MPYEHFIYVQDMGDNADGRMLWKFGINCLDTFCADYHAEYQADLSDAPDILCVKGFETMEEATSKLASIRKELAHLKDSELPDCYVDNDAIYYMLKGFESETDYIKAACQREKGN